MEIIPWIGDVGVYWEAGPYDGAWFEAFRKVNRVTEAHLFEPLYGRDKKTTCALDALQGCEVHGVALGDTTATVSMDLPTAASRTKRQGSLLRKSWKPVQMRTKRVRCMRGEDVKALSPNMLKIDCEGFTYQILTGFGERLGGIRWVLAEVEEIPCWQGQVLAPEIRAYMEAKGFRIVGEWWPQAKRQGDILWTLKQED